MRPEVPNPWMDDPEAPEPTLPASAMGELETALRPRQRGEEAPRPVGWALVVYAGANLGRVFPLVQGENLLGRASQAAVSLLDEEVSRLHARLTLEGPGEDAMLLLEDLDSTNGTFVNGTRLLRPQPVRAGDRIGIGAHVLKLVAMDALERSFHETLLDQSTRDALTGLGNRGTTLQELQSRFELSQRHDRPLSVVMCDLDAFKTVNDTHGHGAGDLVLATFGERVRQNLRGSDLAGRIGGEEFLLVLPETDLAGATLLAERLCEAVRAAPVALPEGPLRVTCSMGVAERRALDRDGGVLLARADAALYEAKREGRDRVVVAAPEP